MLHHQIGIRKKQVAKARQVHACIAFHRVEAEAEKCLSIELKQPGHPTQVISTRKVSLAEMKAKERNKTERRVPNRVLESNVKVKTEEDIETG